MKTLRLNSVIGADDIAEIQRLINAYVLDEREACAKMVDHILREGGGTYGDAIRERSNVQAEGAAQALSRSSLRAPGSAAQVAEKDTK